MIAAEKLKALDEAITQSPTWLRQMPLASEQENLVALRSVLPQIVAVVEAAELADDAFENYRNAPDGELSDYAVEEVLAKLVNARIALAALEEALT